MRRLAFPSVLAVALWLLAPQASAQRILQLHFVPAAPRAQFAVWIESPDGVYLRTLGITQAVSLYGIGNRPGAMEMNSGYRWPYGRREGVLPVWGHRRASAPGAELFHRVIFQNRLTEGYASRTSEDSTRDDYFCLSFDRSRSGQGALDAMSCASVFNSDKGRYITDEDVAGGYAEPIIENGGGEYLLDLFSLYPPRRDVRRCSSPGCRDRADVDLYDADARRVMPEIDAVTMATARAGSPVDIVFTVPDEWAPGTYTVYVETNVEGDPNESFPAPPIASDYSQWDTWAIGFGYSYRGQPSVVYRMDVALDENGATASTLTPAGYGSVDGRGSSGGDMHEMDGSITMDPDTHPGSGGDRLQIVDGARVTATVIPPVMCDENTPPGTIEGFAVSQYSDRRQAHHWAHVTFVAPTDDQHVTRYELRFAQTPITDLESFTRAMPGQAANLASQAVEIPTSAAPGQSVSFDIGQLTFSSHYWVAVRALDGCNASGPIAVTEFTTPAIEFTTVSPCFVATAAYGSPMASEVGALRRFRDRYLMSSELGHALVSAYYEVGPVLADAIRDDEDRRTAARSLLAPVVWMAEALVGESR